MGMPYRFDRSEFAGSLGDLGTLLPMAIGMILVNNLNPTGLFFSVGLFYVASGLYYGVTVPVQPMKVIGAYAITTGVSGTEIIASGAWMALILMIIGLTGTANLIGRVIPKPVVRGVQLSTGALLMAQGIRFIAGTSLLQSMQKAAEPYLVFQGVGPIPIGLFVGVVGGILTLSLLDNKRFPAGLVLVAGGLVMGLMGGTREGFDFLSPGIYPPPILPTGIPGWSDFTFALLVLVLPQVPMTLGNAVVANADLSREYFGDDSKRVTCNALCLTMSAANLLSAFMGGMPLCHGAGGLAAHYRFGARTAGSNLMIGALFLLLALVLGRHVLAVAYLLPLSVLGLLLFFAGAQLALTVSDIERKKDLFVCLVMLGITLAANLAVGFLAGIAVAFLLRWEELTI